MQYKQAAQAHQMPKREQSALIKSVCESN